MVGVDSIGGVRRCVLCIEFGTVPFWALSRPPPSPRAPAPFRVSEATTRPFCSQIVQKATYYHFAHKSCRKPRSTTILLANRAENNVLLPFRSQIVKKATSYDHFAHKSSRQLRSTIISHTNRGETSVLHHFAQKSWRKPNSTTILFTNRAETHVLLPFCSQIVQKTTFYDHFADKSWSEKTTFYDHFAHKWYNSPLRTKAARGMQVHPGAALDHAAT